MSAKTIIYLLVFAVSPPAFGQTESEDFQSFCFHFFTDSAFQSSRISFPLKTIRYSEGFEKVDSLFTSEKHWQFSDFGYLGRESPDNYHVQIYDNFSQVLRNTGERVVAFEGLENGIHLSLFFRLQSSKWILVKIEDFST